MQCVMCVLLHHLSLLCVSPLCSCHLQGLPAKINKLLGKAFVKVLHVGEVAGAIGE